MKQPKRLTYNQKKLVSSAGLNWHDWSCIEETKYYLVIKNKHTHMTKIIDKI